ncbi:uncharacterized protein N7479_009358 [Penicillium vulpinum]|uniref:LDB19 N-terminal domain-containing protein n=1 Tax=Penicillium vulpinum TaxID=29845 RepID=A0A1V6RV37_9EURO|nr:uncharacterized protein N7479_009358 [Penicillium vulpinum]KAJ5950945.1 hypothetical protein N7479_009358 [Penicillium vulpinum]OQE05349.1 hypothetical protein PENVUL_c025G03382 [Penicillium vulpinum]
MNPLNLELAAPSIHYINSQCHEKHELSALSGHVILSATSFLPLINVTEVHVRLIQVFTSTTDSKSTRRISCPSFYNRTSNSTQLEPSIERTLGDVSLPILSKERFETSPGSIVSNSYFCLDIPTNIPATTKTPLGTITYTIEATAATSKHRIITHRRPLRLNRQMIQSDLTKTQHHLSFPTSNAIQRMTLTQNSTPRSGPRISFTATIHTHWKTAPADRETELCHLVVRELRWHAEEIVKVMSKPDSPDEKYSICERQSVRKLCDGSIKGYWGSGINPYVKQLHGYNVEGKGGEKPAICIPFGFTIPKRAMAVDDIDLVAYGIGTDRADHAPQCSFPEELSFPSGKMVKGITVHHQLKIELVTGEDVFHTGTSKLVERKRLRTIACSAIPLNVCEVSI